jgi:hypothetical protein
MPEHLLRPQEAADILAKHGNVVAAYQADQRDKLWIVMRQIHSRSHSFARFLQDPVLFAQYIQQHDAICRARTELGTHFGEGRMHDCLEGTIPGDIPSPGVKTLIERDYHNTMNTLPIAQRVNAFRNVIHRLVTAQQPDEARIAVRYLGASNRLKVLSNDPAKVLSDTPLTNDPLIAKIRDMRAQGRHEEALAIEKEDFTFRHGYIADNFRPVMNDGHLGHIVIGGGHTRHGTNVRGEMAGLHLEDFLEKEGGSIIVWEGHDYEALKQV